MSTLNPVQQQALNTIVLAVRDALAEAPNGFPSGHLYAALMQYGCSFNQYTSLIGAMERKGMIRRDGDLLFATKAGA